MEQPAVTSNSIVIPMAAEDMTEVVRQMREDFTRMMMEYQFAVDEVLTKVNILREEFMHLQRYNPIEHVSSRVKAPESIVGKMRSRGVAPSIQAIRENIHDIAGIRITCSFIADTYRMLEALTSQDDVTVVQIKDYIAQPKPNGYKSLHAIIDIPVFLSTGPIRVPVEVQIRTVAMDFWATLEHKIFYKYEGAVPDHLVEELTQAARVAEDLDLRMEQLHREVHGNSNGQDDAQTQLFDEALLRELWQGAKKARRG